jgi:hypothetical protein
VSGACDWLEAGGTNNDAAARLVVERWLRRETSGLRGAVSYKTLTTNWSPGFSAGVKECIGRVLLAGSWRYG